MRGLAAVVTMLGIFAAPSWAQAPLGPQADPCGECRKSADAEKARCESSAADARLREACAKRASEAMLACQLGACKPGAAPAAGTCPMCQHRVSEEDKACRTMSPGSPDHVLCTQRVGRMKAQCEATVCKPAASK